MRELARTLDVSLGDITHHVRSLESDEAIVGLSDGHYRRYFLPTLVLPQEARRLGEADRRLLSECHRPASLAIILHLAVDGPSRHGELSDRLGRSRGTTTFHLSRLATAGIIRVIHGSSEGRYELVDRDRTIRLLVTFSRSLRDRVDDFAGLWLALGRRES
jgi:DNA-binding MarR family transcriptional regulator